MIDPVLTNCIADVPTISVLFCGPERGRVAAIAERER